jgi:omega-6 fatty acid desaturase (delta-12 desaturase)
MPGASDSAAASYGFRVSTRDQSLAEVLRVIPKSCYDNPTWKGLAYVVRDLLLHGAVLVGLTLTDSAWLLIPLWVLSALTVSALFVLGHDAAHGALFKSKRLCYVVGQLVMLPALHVYEAWVFGHNRLHHGHTVREGMDFVWHPLTPEQYASFSPLQKLRHRVEWSALGAGAYYLRDVWWNKMMHFTPPPKLARDMNRDWWIVVGFAAVATLGLGALGVWTYGTLTGAIWMVLKLLIVPFLLFSWTIGWTVYVHHIDPDIRWYPRRDWTKFRGQMEGTTILHIVPGLHVFFHRIFLHVPHHVDMRIPFYRLPEAADAIVAAYPDVVNERRFHWRDYLRAVRHCKLYDFEHGTWLTYAQARSRPAAESSAA